MHHRYHHLLIIASVLLTAIAVSGCGVLIGLGHDDCRTGIRQMLEITPPASATIISESCSSFINDTYRITFTIPPEELTNVQNLAHVANWSSDYSRIGIWKDEASTISSAIFGSYNDGAISEEVLIDTSRSDLYTVYFYRSFVD